MRYFVGTVAGTKLDERIDDIMSGKAFLEDNTELRFHYLRCVECKRQLNELCQRLLIISLVVCE